MSPGAYLLIGRSHRTASVSISQGSFTWRKGHVLLAAASQSLSARKIALWSGPVCWSRCNTTNSPLLVCRNYCCIYTYICVHTSFPARVAPCLFGLCASMPAVIISCRGGCFDFILVAIQYASYSSIPVGISRYIPIPSPPDV